MWETYFGIEEVKTTNDMMQARPSRKSDYFLINSLRKLCSD